MHACGHEKIHQSLRVQHTHHCYAFRSQGVFHDAIPGQPRNPAWWDGISGVDLSHLYIAIALLLDLTFEEMIQNFIVNEKQ